MSDHSNVTHREFPRHALKTGFFLLFVACLTSCATFLPSTPPPKIPRIAFLDIGNSGPLYDSFRQGLRDLGYVDDKNIVVDYRPAVNTTAAGSIMRELVNEQVDVIVTASQEAALQAKYETNTIPIVMANSVDPIDQGLIESLAHPGGNVTGMTTFSPMLSGKRLEVLKQTVAKMERVAVISCTGSGINSQIAETRDAAQGLNVHLAIYNLTGLATQAFSQLTKENFDAILFLDCPAYSRNAATFAELFDKYQLPTMYFAKEFVVAGGLMSYGPNLSDSYRRAAAYVDKIMKGRKPADLPVELPTKFDLVINLKTAKELGITIPQSVLAQATEVINE